MKSEPHKWSSVNEVLESFKSVSLMPGASNRESDIITCPSPPTHRLSPSQLEFLQHMGYRSDNALEYPSSRVSMGRGRALKYLSSKICPKVRDAALMCDIRATRKKDYSNAAIEEFVNNNMYQNSGNIEQVAFIEDSERSDECLLDEKFSDKLSINTTLRPDANVFYPSGMTPDPVKLSECLEKLKKERAFCSVASNSSSPVKESPRKFSAVSNGHRKDYESSSKADSHIGFANSFFDNESDDDDLLSPENTAANDSVPNSVVTYSSSCTTSPSANLNSSALSFQKNLVDIARLKCISSSSPPSLMKMGDGFVQENIICENAVKQPRPKKLMRNALLSSLKGHVKSPERQLMKPIDFESSSFKLQSELSAFHPVTHSFSNVDNNDLHLATPYDFLSDPSIDIETKELLKSMTSSPASTESSTSPLSQNIKFSNPGISLNSNKSSLCQAKPKFSSSHEFKLNKEEFPPLS